MTEQDKQSIVELTCELEALKRLRNAQHTRISTQQIDDAIAETEAIISKRLSEGTTTPKQLLKG